MNEYKPIPHSTIHWQLGSSPVDIRFTPGYGWSVDDSPFFTTYDGLMREVSRILNSRAAFALERLKKQYLHNRCISCSMYDESCRDMKCSECRSKKAVTV